MHVLVWRDKSKRWSSVRWSSTYTQATIGTTCRYSTCTYLAYFALLVQIAAVVRYALFAVSICDVVLSKVWTNTLLLLLRMASRHHCIVLGLVLLLQLNLCATLLVQRSIGGDLFQNLASEADYCHQRGAVCSTTRLEELDPTCGGIVPGDLCPTCACSVNWRYNYTNDTCIQDSASCPDYAGIAYFTSRIQLPFDTQQVLLVNATFSCSGVVRAWQFIKLVPAAATFFYLQVWRLDGEVATRIGSSRIDVMEDNSPEDIVLSTFLLEESDLIQVEAGDFLGVYVPNGVPQPPISSRRFGATQFASELYSFFVSSGVLPTAVNIAQSDAYNDNLGTNIHAITDFLEGQVQCFSESNPTPQQPQDPSPNIPEINRVTSSPVANQTVTASSHFVRLMPTTSSPSPVHSQVNPVHSQSPVHSPATTPILSMNYKVLTSTMTTTVHPLSTTGPTTTGEVVGSSTSSDSTPEFVHNILAQTLTIVCVTILVLVSVVLVTVCLIWRKRKRVLHIKPTSDNNLTLMQRANSEQLASSLTSQSDIPLCPMRPTQRAASAESAAYYHVLSPDDRSQSLQSLNSTKTTLSIHIHCDSDPRLHIKRSNSRSEHVYHVVVPTKDERQAQQQKNEQYSRGGPQSDEEYIYPVGQEQRGEYFQEVHVYWTPADCEDELYTQFSERKYHEILRKYIRTGDNLGSGHFGLVQRGFWQTHDGPVEVAVKTLNPGLSERERVKFLQEAAIMGQFSHPNIVELFGVVTVGDPIMIVLELMSNGDLRNYLLSLRESLGQPESQEYPHRFLQNCRHIASGMEHLSSKGFVHRDLAARNVMLNKELVCKIGDFGMARDLLDEDYYCTHGGPIPLKWTAPEALNFKRYTTASDVWSYGVVLFEIWSVGMKPFASIGNLEVVALVNSGHRLPPPQGCSEEIYRLMLQCWHPDPSKRPTFTQIIEVLSVEDDLLLTWPEQQQQQMAGGNKRPVALTESLNSAYTEYVTIQNQETAPIAL